MARGKKFTAEQIIRKLHDARHRQARARGPTACSNRSRPWTARYVASDTHRGLSPSSPPTASRRRWVTVRSLRENDGRGASIFSVNTRTCCGAVIARPVRRPCRARPPARRRPATGCCRASGRAGTARRAVASWCHRPDDRDCPSRNAPARIRRTPFQPCNRPGRFGHARPDTAGSARALARVRRSRRRAGK